jgi:O-antigen/teichoic acid export membrane protein
MLRLFGGYGVIVQMSGLLGMFLYSIEKLIAGVFIGVGATGILDIGEKLPVMASQVPATMNGIFLPAMSHMTSLDRIDEVGKLYLKGARYMSMMMGLVLGFMAAFASPLITAWIGPDERYKTAALILALVCLPYQMNEMTGPCSAFHRAAGKPARELFYPISQLVLVLITVGIGFAFFEKTVLVIVGGVAISMVTSAVLYMLYTNRYLGVGTRDFAWKVLAPGLLPYAFGFALSRAAQPLIEMADTSRWKTLGLIALCGLVYAPIATAALYRLMCDWGEREFLRKQIIHTAGGLLRLRKQTA